ncbi:sigma-70 family RNA polymerase sigma factor [Sabulilitoribacter arenilitoris]|uniref:Sigma-70 family RNA polymerase sigma factor n=1 Tax=Wocania arenilitoris TaxID=2044858 RepID=A0AAE3JLX0_9FLAO|nr:sigma-70 family RNA polymerase sigma factor [Wocania arenilitoris]
MNNEILIKELSNGNEKALDYLMDNFHQPLCAYASSLCHDHDTSKDIVQNVFIRLWVKRKEIKDIRSIKDFLYKSVRNEFIDEQRKEKRRSLAYEERYIQSLNAIVENHDEELLKKRISLIQLEIEKLPKRCKETFLLSKKEGLSNSEIATYMKVSIKTVERQMTKAFDILRVKLKNEFKHLFFFLILSRKNIFNYNI